MKYSKYLSFISYLVSDEAKTNPYDETCVYLTSAGNANAFNPALQESTNGYDLPEAYVKGMCQPISKFDMKHMTHVINPGVFTSDTSSMTSELDCYEKAFNEPCSAHISNSSYILDYMNKTYYDTTVEGDGISNSELADQFSFKNEFDKDEYYKWDIPMTPLNNNEACLSGQNVTLSGINLVPAKGFLYAVRRDDRVIPMGYCDFERTSICSHYGITWSHHGILKLH